MCQYHDDDRMNLYDHGPPEGPFPAIPGVDGVYVAEAHIVGTTGQKSHILVTATGLDLKNHPHEKIAAKGRALRCALLEKYVDDALQATGEQTLERGWNDPA